MVLIAAISMVGISLESVSVDWKPVPLVSAQQRSMGMKGGEGGQWPRALQWAPDGSYVFLGTDVGGLYRSGDGNLFEPSNVGYTPRGTADLEVDPVNSKRMLSIGANSTDGMHHGIWLSVDGGRSWKQVFPANISSNHDMRDQLAYDPTTKSADGSMCRVVYWSRVAEDKATWGTPEIKPRLYKSADGGETWNEIPNSEPYGGSWIKHHPTRAGVLYAGNRQGVHVSTDGGATFRKTAEGDVTGLSVSTAAPNSVWVSMSKSVLRSDDSGGTWKPLPVNSLLNGEDRLWNLNVSPVEPRRMVIWRESVPNIWQWPRYYSEDGGQTWQASTFKEDGKNYLPRNARQGLFAWHPKRAKEVWSLGGDWAVRSTDGGKTYEFGSDGYNGVLVGGRWAFSTSDPNLVFFGSQDYNGSVTTNAGQSWLYLNPAGNHWGGFCYGGYALDRQTFVVGNAGGWGEPRILRVSFDAGATWADTGIKLSGPDVSYGMPGNPKVGFAFDHRTEDGGRNWKKMDGCDGVFTHFGRTLYGSNGKFVVRSGDEGRTWSPIMELPGPIADLAVASESRVFVVSNERAYVWDGEKVEPMPTPTDQLGNHRERTVAVDPSNPKVVYVGRAGNSYVTHSAVLRSVDGGRTFVNLTRQLPIDGKLRDGGREAICIRVHPRTREVFVATSCYGIWKVAGP